MWFADSTCTVHILWLSTYSCNVILYVMFLPWHCIYPRQKCQAPALLLAMTTVVLWELVRAYRRIACVTSTALSLMTAVMTLARYAQEVRCHVYLISEICLCIANEHTLYMASYQFASISGINATSEVETMTRTHNIFSSPTTTIQLLPTSTMHGTFIAMSYGWLSTLNYV